MLIGLFFLPSSFLFILLFIETATSCPKGTFQCRNNRCRSTAILCSGLLNSCLPACLSICLVVWPPRGPLMLNAPSNGISVAFSPMKPFLWARDLWAFSWITLLPNILTERLTIKHFVSNCQSPGVDGCGDDSDEDRCEVCCKFVAVVIVFVVFKGCTCASHKIFQPLYV